MLISNKLNTWPTHRTESLSYTAHSFGEERRNFWHFLDGPRDSREWVPFATSFPFLFLCFPSLQEMSFGISTWIICPNLVADFALGWVGGSRPHKISHTRIGAGNFPYLSLFFNFPTLCINPLPMRSQAKRSKVDVCEASNLKELSLNRSDSWIIKLDLGMWDYLCSRHQYTKKIVWEILRCGAMHMTSHKWNLSRFLSLTCVFLGALGREDRSP